jgi:hypothetical protein
MHFSKVFTCINSFNFHNNGGMEVLSFHEKLEQEVVRKIATLVNSTTDVHPQGTRFQYLTS